MNSKRGDQHRYGQHYTPAEVARLLAALAIESSDDRVLDPSCGDGRLLEQSLRLKNHLARRADKRLASQLFGVDRSMSAVKMAARTGARVVCADFFDLEPDERAPGRARLPAEFDAIIGNPPYIRQEMLGPEEKRRIGERLQADRRRAGMSRSAWWPEWSGRSDIYVYFFARSVRFLKAGGRLVFLTASSWLDAGYGRALREFLLKNFRILAIIESSAESFFADASINTVITVAAREEDESALRGNVVRFVRLTAPLAAVAGIAGDFDEAIAFARSIEIARSSESSATYRLRAVDQSHLLSHAIAGEGWGKYLRADDVFFQIIERGSARLRRLSHLARVRFGLKTGANEFFYLKGPKAMKRLAEVASVRRGLTTGANEFFYLKAVGRRTASLCLVEDNSGARRQIESRYLSPVVFSLKEISGVVLDTGQTKRLFFNCPARRSRLAGTKAFDYIEGGERAGYHLRPTCAARDQWYSIARGMKPAPLIFPSKVGERWLVALNRARVFEDKKLYGVFPLEEGATVLLAALLNSTWARYYAEITCRQMTGAQAIADIDVAVAEQIMLPDPRALPEALKRRLEAALEALARRAVVSIFEEIKLPDRRRLDEAVLAAIGFGDRAERERVLDELYRAVVALVRARLDK
jgi:methylase of polypeptide subunit release factors